MTKFLPRISSFSLSLSLSLKKLYLATFVESITIAYCDSLVAMFLTVAIKIVAINHLCLYSDVFTVFDSVLKT